MCCVRLRMARLTDIRTIGMIVQRFTSLGATESLICIPYLTTMLYLPPERRTTFGVKKNTVRLSAGIEDSDRLVADLKQALVCVSRGDSADDKQADA